MTVVQVLRKARALVVKGWTRKAYARDKWRHRVDINSPRATCFCGDGAVRKVTGLVDISRGPFNKPTPIYSRVRAALDGAIGGLFPEFNDSHTKDDVVAAFDKAIKVASK